MTVVKPIKTMSREIKINNPEGVYFLTFATVGWVDVFTRKFYCDMLLDSFRYCQKKKTLVIYAWCIMSNHVHLIASAGNGNLSGILRDMEHYLGNGQSLVRKIIVE